jgi:hypothetical protein
LLVLAAGVLYALGTTNAHAAPAAGTVIGNQATATYNDAGGAPRTATSNLVTTTVSQVKIFTLTANGARTAAPGQTVYYPHTITNTGNGVDTYALNARRRRTSQARPRLTARSRTSSTPTATACRTTRPRSHLGRACRGRIFRFVVAGTVPGRCSERQHRQHHRFGLGYEHADPTTITNTDTTTVANSVIV